MKYLKYKCLLAIILGCSLSGCFDLTEEVFDRVDSGVYYQDENSVKSGSYYLFHRCYQLC